MAMDLILFLAVQALILWLLWARPTIRKNKALVTLPGTPEILENKGGE